MYIKEMLPDERPRERLVIYGAKKLSNKELLEIVFRTGSKSVSVSNLAEDVLKSIKNISELKELSLNSLKSIKGLKDAKAITLLAAIELGRRVYNDEENPHKIKIRSTDDVFRVFQSLFENKQQEELLAIFLNTKKIIIDYKFIFKGSLDQSVIHPREIFKEALKVSASSMIIAHNHPSGDIMPSNNDMEVTKKLIECGKTMSIPIIDHIIFGSNTYYSFLEHGDINYE